MKRIIQSSILTFAMVACPCVGSTMANESATASSGVLQPKGLSSMLSLAGEWQFKLGAFTEGDAWQQLEDKCILPGTLDQNKKGTINDGVCLYNLNRKYYYTGPALYQKSVLIPADWNGKSITLMMERTKNTRVWVNGKEQTMCNANNTYGVPQVYTLWGLNAGQYNTITIEIENATYPVAANGHMFTDETVTNWNGVIGRIELSASDTVYLDQIRVYPDIHAKTATIKANVCSADNAGYEGTITLNAQGYNGAEDSAHPAQGVFNFKLDKGTQIKQVTYTYNMGDDVRLWSEFDPNLYHLTAQLKSGERANTQTVSFGMREFGTKNQKFTINGTTTFLRGEGNSAVFPLTGYPFMTKTEWLDFFKKAQALGINFFRFHTWTPPQAAFEAADELGVYMQPELYGFGGTPFGQWYTDEAQRIMEHLANHPSFVLFAFGNEMGTGWDGCGLNELFAFCKNYDETRLYAEGSNNNFYNPILHKDAQYWTTYKTVRDDKKYPTRLSYSWGDDATGGVIESDPLATTFTYEDSLKGIPVPVMNHEAGQYQALPYFEQEIPKYAPGIFAPRNLQAYKDMMEDNGILDMNLKFAEATARLAAIGYKADIEAALRTNQLAGYQLLSIQDFPGQGTAHVGILDNFMDDKPGGFSKAKYKSFNDDRVILALLPQLIYTNDEVLTGDIAVSNYGPSALSGMDAKWVLKEGATIVDSGTLAGVAAPQGQVTKLGGFRSELSGITQAKRLVLELSVEGTKLKNSYDIWVYPAQVEETVGDLVVTSQWNKETHAALKAGKKVLLLPMADSSSMPESIPVRWMTDFWSLMFHGYGQGFPFTMGMYVDKSSKLFKGFPTDTHSDYQWFHLAKGSRALDLTDSPRSLTPIVWNIDHMSHGRKLSSLFEAKVGAGKLLICTFDLMKQKDVYPEAKQLYCSVLNYMNSSEFQPLTTLEEDDVSLFFVEEGGKLNAYQNMEAERSSVKNAAGSFIERGSSENREIEKALGGLKAGDWVCYKAISFGQKTADSFVLSGANGNGTAAEIELRLDSPYGPLVTSAAFTGSGSWNQYQSQRFAIPALSGLHDVYLVFKNGSFAFNSFHFEESKVSYGNPYREIQPEITDGARTVLEGALSITQLYLQNIGKGAVITVKDMDFGFNRQSTHLVLKGRTKKNANDTGDQATNNGQDVTGVVEYVDQNGETVSAPFTFQAGKGSSYKISSERFWTQALPLAGITGVQNVKIKFTSEVLFDLECFSFVPDDK